MPAELSPDSTAGSSTASDSTAGSEMAKNPRAFPKLTDDQIAVLKSRMTRRTYPDGAALMIAGSPDFCFHLVESGELDVVAMEDCQETVILVHGPGDFTGDVEDLSGRGASVTVRAKGPTTVWEMSLEDLRATINDRIDLADTIMTAFIARWQSLRDARLGSVYVIGRQHESATFMVVDFLRRNRALFNFVDLDADAHAGDILREMGLEGCDLPVVKRKDEWTLVNPGLRELGERLGLSHAPEKDLYDLAIIGAGPAGLAAAVYGGSEGLSTVIIDDTAPGGQAGASMRIENYLGFPIGLTGEELANRATLQTQKFGVEIAVPFCASELTVEDGHNVVVLDGGDAKVRARCILIATGARYRKLDLANMERYEGAGIYYAATPIEASLCRDEEVVIVGGGNSAGQAAVYLAGNVRKVCVCIRGNDLRKNMSEYLVQRIESLPNIEVHADTEVTALSGDGALDCVEITCRKSGDRRSVQTAALFLFIGVEPCTDWLPAALRSDKDFVLTGSGIDKSRWPLTDREPYYLETEVPGVFAAGDVRLGSVKRVASGVGEGAMSVQFIHQYLSGLPQR